MLFFANSSSDRKKSPAACRALFLFVSYSSQAQAALAESLAAASLEAVSLTALSAASEEAASLATLSAASEEAA